MKLGSLVLSTMNPLKNPMPMATTKEIGIAIHRLSPAPPSSPVSFTSRIVRIPIAPVMAPDDRSNSPPIISIDTATAMMPSVAATSSTVDVPPTVPNCPATAQKNTQIATAPMMAPISGRMNNRWMTLRYASRSSAISAASAASTAANSATVTSLIVSQSPSSCSPTASVRGRPPEHSRPVGGHRRHGLGKHGGRSCDRPPFDESGCLVRLLSGCRPRPAPSPQRRCRA